MARGWESKSVESQMETAAEREQVRKAPKSHEELEIERRRDGFLLQRTRVLREIENCHHERYRDTLRRGLEYLEEQLRATGWAGSPSTQEVAGTEKAEKAQAASAAKSG